MAEVQAGCAADAGEMLTLQRAAYVSESQQEIWPCMNDSGTKNSTVDRLATGSF